MAIIDSQAAFLDRCKKFGLDQVLTTVLQDNGIASFGAFAHVARFNPAATDDQPLSDAIEAISGTKPTALQMTHLRRLHFEAHTMSVAEARHRIEQTEDSMPRKLPAPERAARYNQQKLRLTGLVWSLNLEPSHRLLDKVQQQIEENTAAFVSLDQCTSRQQEMAGVKREQSVKIDTATGVMKIAEHEADLWSNTSTDHHLRLAFRRRALAYDQSGLAGYEVMEVWTEKLFSAMLEQAPPGYSAPSRDRILGADRQLFSKVVEMCREGVSVTVVRGVATRPVEAAIQALANDSTVIFHLLPLPNHSGPSSAFKALSDDGPILESNNQRKKRRKAAQAEARGSEVQHVQQAKGSSKGSQAGKGKGKSKGKGKHKFDANGLPSALKGCNKTVKGERACIWFNLGICDNQANPGEICRQGIHLCMAPECGDLHPAISCPHRLGRAVQ